MGLEGHRGLEQRNPESPGCYRECVGMGLRKGESEILRWLPYNTIFFPLLKLCGHAECRSHSLKFTC